MHSSEAAASGSSCPIPKIVHQILLPHHRTDNTHLWERSEWMRATWKAIHPTWEYRLWTDPAELSKELIASKAYYANRNPAHRADILRYEILHRYGGVYTDIDVACLKPFDPLLDGHGTAWIGGLSEKHYNPDPSDPTLHQTIEIALLGSVPGHPFFKRLLDGIVTRREQLGPNFWAIHLTRRTGPFWFELNLNEAGAEAGVTVLPGSYFYPTDFRHTGEPERWVAEKHAEADAYCRHYWWGSWYKHSPLVHENGRSDPRVGAES